MAAMPGKAVNGALLGCFCARTMNDATLLEIAAYSAIVLFCGLPWRNDDPRKTKTARGRFWRLYWWLVPLPYSTLAI